MPHAIRHAPRHAAVRPCVFRRWLFSSGYYSYMWSEVMDADAFAAFEEAGGAFDPEKAKALEDPHPVYWRFAAMQLSCIRRSVDGCRGSRRF